MGRDEWPPSGSGTGRDLLRPTLALFRTVAERNHARSRRRLLRARYFNTRDDTVDDWEDEVRHVEPSDYESIPAESQETNSQPAGIQSPPPIQHGPSLHRSASETPRGHHRSGIHEKTLRGTWQAAGFEYGGR